MDCSLPDEVQHRVSVKTLIQCLVFFYSLYRRQNCLGGTCGRMKEYKLRIEEEKHLQVSQIIIGTTRQQTFLTGEDMPKVILITLVFV